MHWTDEAIILSARKHGEHQALVRLFARQHGVFASIAQGAYSKAQRGIYQPGNIVSVKWNARLAEHMGSVSAEMQEPVTAFIMNDPLKLAALSSAATLMEMILPERHPYPTLYRRLQEMLMHLKHSESWQEDYVRFELALLAESGFGLDLGSCAATGRQEDLTYVSPKSGRSVSTEAGEPYKDKLLALPGFLSPEVNRKKTGCGTQEILAGLRLSGYFLDHWLTGPHGKKLPAARSRLVELIEK